ncbi:PPE family protein [Candidatus Mycobacterium methanotrophicum]|uniref:PPE family protein n=1 Tax=Candidatus Mycobacterium methanotrophicum TaxID=2943498 RepID=A0ABY4QTS6_9MYCO|nr:PPE family protein [Candidatus Mycobacterium methanotrophicum]UQX13506.1 PPE family protein [Candidatus Mycobacterium methanotrophicum]
MDFGALPPEITSGRMYSGAGSGSMLAAAVAWDGLAAELQSTATSYSSVISRLTSGSWTGPSSASMAVAAAPYVAWMSDTAAQAKEAALQARAAAAAYETAFAATVPPPMIAANRSQLASLVATNIFGQNTAAITATEAQYGEMWAQDAAAMYGYAGSSAAATQVTPFTEPPQTTNAAGLAAQGAAVAQAAGSSTGTGAQSILSGIPQLLQELASASTSWNTTIGGLLNSLTGSSSAASVYQSLFAIGSGAKAVLPINDAMISTILGMVEFQTFFYPLGLGGALGDLLPKLGAGMGEAGALGAARLGVAASASVGRAGLVGMLSVPPSWAAATPAIRMLAGALADTNLTAPPMVLEADPGGLFSQIGLASLAGCALGSSASRVAATSFKGSAKPARLERVVAELAKQPDNPAVQHWHTDSAGLESLVAELSQKPGIHAVHLSSGTQTRPTPKPQLF